MRLSEIEFLGHVPKAPLSIHNFLANFRLSTFDKKTCGNPDGNREGNKGENDIH